MELISYACDVELMGCSYLDKDDKNLKNIIKNFPHFTYSINIQDDIFGYYIHKNEPLSKIYNFDVFMVDFLFSSVSRLHTDEQERIMTQLLNEVKKHIKNNKGYYNFRVPSHIVDLNKSFNKIFSSFIFCGGLITYLNAKCEKRNLGENKNEISVFLPNKKYLDEHNMEITQVAKDAFHNYQGQYHISYITAEKAGDIYTDWVKKGFSERQDSEKIILAEYRDELVGFWTYTEEAKSIQTGLTGVSSKYRNLGIYSNMLKVVLNESLSKNKFITIGTQFDNLIVQRAWNKVGMVPYLSYFNIHIDGR